MVSSSSTTTIVFEGGMGCSSVELGALEAGPVLARQEEAEGRAGRRLGGDVDRAAVGVDDLLRDEEAEPEAPRALVARRASEGLEEDGEDLGRNGAGVVHGDAEVLGAPPVAADL